MPVSDAVDTARHGRGLTTTDDVPLREVLDMGERILDSFNNEADFPFRDLLVEDVGEQMFKQFPPGEFDWEELAEGEYPRTAEMDDPVFTTVQTAEYGRALGFTQRFFEDHDSREAQRRFQKLVAGATKLQRDHILQTIDNGIADGTSDVWYEIDDYGAYEFNQNHDHWFETTDDLLSSLSDTPSTGTAITPTKHVEFAIDHLRHHGNGDQPVVLTGAPFKRKLKDELTVDANYHIPMAEGLREEDYWNADLMVDGARFVQTSWLDSTEFYVVDLGAEDGPIYMNEKRPVQLTRANGGQVNDPAELVGASGTGRWGFRMIDPLAGVYVNADNVTTT